MKTEPVSLGEMVYEAEIHFTDIVDYGVGIDAISSPSPDLPPAGVRFDYAFEGTLQGPRLRGTIAGTDYLYVRADGRFQLHIHARITTDDGVPISFASEGVTFRREGVEGTQMRASVTLFTNSARYGWLNQLQLWALGTMDIEKGQVRVQAYAA